MRRLLLAVLLGIALGASAQDILSIGSGAEQVPISVAKQTANVVQGVAFKVLFDGSRIASMSFARTGALGFETPLFETSMQGSGWFSYVVMFDAGTNVSGQIGILTANPQPGEIAGSVIPLLFHAPSAMLSNQTGSVTETVANGALALVNGSITVSSTIAAPTGVSAIAVSTTQVNVSWNIVAPADHYEVWRSVDGGAYALIASPSGTSFSNMSLTAGKTYLYRLRSIDSGGAPSAFSNVDAATTIVFTDDPLVVRSTRVKTVHLTQLRSAVNAMRASAGLPSFASDPTIATGLVVRASHITALRTALNEARASIGLPALSYTDTAPAIIKAAHVQELRSGVM